MSTWQIICADWREIGVPQDAAAILTDPLGVEIDPLFAEAARQRLTLIEGGPDA